MLITSNQFSGMEKQRGLALLALVITIALVISFYYFSSISIIEIQVQNLEKSRASLLKAKQALIAYALNYPLTPAGLGNANQGPGNLPCPDDDLDGDSDTPGIAPACNSLGAGTIGRFPWATVATEELRDGAGELLWYAVSSNFANFADRNINSATTGQITVRNSDGSVQFDGTTIDGVVAVVIAPGKALVRSDGLVQSRATVADRNDPANYLDIAFAEDNADYINSTGDGFISGIVRNNADGEIVVNDLVVVITYNEILEVVNARVGEAFKELLTSYHVTCDAYPEASSFDPTKASFDSAGLAPPVGSELRFGHVPLNSALPVDWGNNCTVGAVTAPAPVPLAWMIAEGWATTTFYNFAFQNAPPANGMTCGNGVNPPCFTVNNTSPLITDAEALVVFAGRDTTGGNRPSNVMSDYFEGENVDIDGIYDASETEDFVKVIMP